MEFWTLIKRGTITASLVFISSCQENPLGTKTNAGASFHPGLGQAPKVTSVSPNTGSISGGLSITLTGTGFNSTTRVKIGNILCGRITYVSSTSLLCSTPSHSAGSKSIYIENADGQKFTLANAFSYISHSTGATSTTIVSGGKKLNGTTLSMDSTIGGPVQGKTMIGVTTQLKLGIQGIIFNPDVN